MTAKAYLPERGDKPVGTLTSFTTQRLESAWSRRQPVRSLINRLRRTFVCVAARPFECQHTACAEAIADIDQEGLRRDREVGRGMREGGACPKRAAVADGSAEERCK